MKKDYWWNESAKSGKDTAPLETPITPAANTTTGPPIAVMLKQSNELAGVPADPTQWLHSVTTREPSREDFLIDSGAATSVCHQSLVDTLERKPRGPEVELRSATGHQFTTTGNTTICLRTRDGINVADMFRNGFSFFWHLKAVCQSKAKYLHHHMMGSWVVQRTELTLTPKSIFVSPVNKRPCPHG